MSRSPITSTSSTTGNDNGNILFSLIQGEQLEFVVTLSFLTSLLNYNVEAVIMEAFNIVGDSSVPTSARVGGVNTTLKARIPLERGAWVAATAYNKDDVIIYNGNYYKLTTGTSIVNSTIPSSNSNWVLYTPNKVYLQFPEALSSGWLVQPSPNVPVHGYFELRVKEPTASAFPKTWKPLRGVVQFLYSPTKLVPDGDPGDSGGTTPITTEEGNYISQYLNGNAVFN